MALETQAERRADKIRDIAGFKDFSLVGVRDQVKEMLNLIGRVDGIFSAYTLHDISHIDAMLNMLNWIIPPDTASSMTTADWLLVVLSVYLHDAGMMVAKSEFDSRFSNSDFCNWFESLEKCAEGRDYLARTKRMSDDEKQSFFFQEFIRMGHPVRISEWVTGRSSNKWGPGVKPISEAVAKLLESLPKRFRECLALVCESHHKDNLDHTNLYPLCEQCGSDIEQGTVNVQYAAIVLRTVDLLHVTKDRTPSIMYKTIGLTDPKAVTEWDKQRDAFAVRHKARAFDPANPDSSVIAICADFTKEEPLFALQQYIAYANTQVSQSKRWADKSQQYPDAQSYSFPWREVRGDVRIEGEKPQPLKFELDRGRLLNLLVGHTIYNDPTVAIRELLQNAIDAVRYQHYLDAREARARGREEPPIGRVTVRWDPDTRTLDVEDDGTGMDRDIIENHLMRVGASYYRTPRFQDDHKDFSPISRFGIGILTCFMISEDIEIVTFRSGKGYRIRMTTVDVDYLLRELSDSDQRNTEIRPHGTRVRLCIRDTVDLKKSNVSDIVRHWVVLPACQVEYAEKGKNTERIGFLSAADALRFYQEHDQEDALPIPSLEQNTYVTKRQTPPPTDTGLPSPEYELAICVQQRWGPERQFVTGPTHGMPAVCLEGIRVSNDLPWFDSLKSSGSDLGAILSIRGDQQLKTTVSRQGLEHDEKYSAVGRLCADMLLEHVADEVVRIAERPGRPLSQASAASYWLFRTLHGCACPASSIYLEHLRAETPTMVIERIIKDADGRTQSARAMISQEDLAKESEIWSVESRLVDSLGTISRDLGKELSLNEFLTTLAPEMRAVPYSPMLPDAHVFKLTLRKSHRADVVRFSRQNQESAVRWIPRSKHDHTWSINMSEVLGQTGYSEFSRQAYALIRAHSLSRIDVEVCSIEGDGQAVDCVATRVVPIMRAGSELAQYYGAIHEGVCRCIKNNLPLNVLVKLVAFANLFVEAARGGLHDRFRYKRNGPEIGFWRENYHDVSAVLRSLGVTDLLPEDVRLYGESLQRFDACSYWLDWWTREEE